MENHYETRYEAPEVYFFGISDQRSDLWSLGIILYEIISGKSFVHTESSAEYLAEVSDFLKSIPPLETYQLSPFYRDYIKAMHTERHIQRPPVRPKDIPEVKWKQYLDLVFGLLKWVPESRIGLKQALFHQFFHQV